MDRFVKRKSITQYRKLASELTNDAERLQILKLLAEKGESLNRNWNWGRPQASTSPRRMCRRTVRRASSLAATAPHRAPIAARLPEGRAASGRPAPPVLFMSSRPSFICKNDKRCRIGQITPSIPEFLSTENAIVLLFLFGPSSTHKGYTHSSDG